MFIVLYIVIAVMLVVLYSGIAYKTIEFILAYNKFRIINIRLPVKPIMLYLIFAYLGYSLFFMFSLIFTFMTLQP